MRIPRIYTPQPLAVGNTLCLDEQSAHHVAKVLRMQSGRPLILFNGDGGEYEANLTIVDKKLVEAEITAFTGEDRESPLTVHLGIGVSRGERMDWVLQKATELGVSTITPLFTERCEVKLNGPRLDKKVEHWQQILISACEQCQRNRLPSLLPPTKLGDWLSNLPTSTPTDHLRFVLHHRSTQGLNASLSPKSVTLAIGPEGGLSDSEIEHCLREQFAPLTLGPRVMRTETAPVTALSIFQYLWGDLNTHGNT